MAGMSDTMPPYESPNQSANTASAGYPPAAPHSRYDAPIEACTSTRVRTRPSRSARVPIANRPTRLPMPIRPTRPTACASPMRRSRAAAETCANGMNMTGLAQNAMKYIHWKLRLRSACRSVAPEAPLPDEAAPGARLSCQAAPKPSSTLPSAIQRSASRHSKAPMAALASSGTATEPAPMPALASPAASPRRFVNHGCTQAMAGV